MWWTMIAAALAAPAPVAPVAPADVSADHAPAALDALLAARDYVALGARIAQVSKQPDLVSDLDWLKNRTLEGNSAFVTMLYSRLLWVAAGGLPDEPKRQWRQTAAMMTLYAYSAIAVDGSRCGDRSAPANRVQQLMAWNPEVWPFIASLTEEERQTLVTIAVAIEARTAPRRDEIGDVDFLCRSGMEETQYNLTHGTAREVPPAPGMIGRQVVLSGDGKYKPSERPEAERAAAAAEKRAALPSALAQMVAGFAAESRKEGRPN